MTLSAGVRLGSYEITSTIGRGGMGEVYCARDSKLSRHVALKVLPAAFASDPDRLARFQREAHVLAALNHPHITHIYGLEESGGVTALVMELVEGQTLAERIAGPLPLEDVVSIARQIAEALEYAHEQGIIHRDLKPANVKVTPDGSVKVLDFGLAKALEPPAAAADFATSAAVTSPAMTEAGIILGTAAYMSPEQARGKPVDHRTDIWAFGCVLYEMLAGKRAFEGTDVTETLAVVLKSEPDWDALGSDTPESIRKLLRRCLEKDRRRRLAAIADARFELEDASPAVSGLGATPAATAERRRERSVLLPWALLGSTLALATVAMLVWAPWERPRFSVVRVGVQVGAPASILTAQGTAIAISPDGSTLAFVGLPETGGGRQQLYVRRLDELDARVLPETAGAMNPFFSPDGQWIGFFADARLKKIALGGGGPVTLADAANGRGGSWAEDGTIVYMPDFYAGLWRISATGGEPILLTTPEVGGTDRWPQILPGGKAVLYTRNSRLLGYDDSDLIVQPLPTGQPKVVRRGGFYGRYLATGHLVYMHEGSFFAAPFDLDRLETTAEPRPVLTDVAGADPFATGAAQFAAAENGTVAYLRTTHSVAPVEWLDGAGRTSTLWSTATNWIDPSFAPNGRQVAMAVSDGRQLDIWVYDLERQTASRLTLDPGDEFKPIWSPDSTRIAFASDRGQRGRPRLYWQRADGTGSAERLTAAGDSLQAPTSWHPTGQFLAFLEANSGPTGFDVKVLPFEGTSPGTPIALADSSAFETEGMFSPDGGWVAYASNASGRFEVYVRPYPESGGVRQISSGGGSFPTWSRRNELLYATPDQRIMVVPYRVVGNSFVTDPERPWPGARYRLRGAGVVNRSFDVHPDGQRIGLSNRAESTGSQGDNIVVVFNYLDELRRMLLEN